MGGGGGGTLYQSSQTGCFKLQLHCAIYQLRFYSNSLIHLLSLSNSHNNVASIQKNRGDKSHRVIVALVNFSKVQQLSNSFQKSAAILTKK